MKVVRTIKRRFGSGPPPRFECGVCAAQFEHEPMNCPACGNTEMRPLDDR